MPFSEAEPIPLKKLNGTDITNAHGHDTTKNVNALYNHSTKFVIVTIGGIIAINIARKTTTGV